MLKKLTGFGPLNVDVDVSAFPTIKFVVCARLVEAVVPDGSPRLAAFFDYLDKMQTEVMESGHSDPNFFKEADRLFPGPEDEIFLSTPAEWSRVDSPPLRSPIRSHAFVVDRITARS